MAQWKDNRRDSAECTAGVFRLVVHHFTGYPPEQYLTSCGGLFEQKILKSTSLEDAKKEAEDILCSYLLGALDALA